MSATLQQALPNPDNYSRYRAAARQQALYRRMIQQIEIEH
jgi:hypothetical protein